ncbi:MAG: hypothetical protein ABI479_08185, partial [Gallionella sp.]
PVSLEVFNDVFRQSDVERTAVDAMRSLIWLEEQSAKWLDAAPAAGNVADTRPAGRHQRVQATGTRLVCPPAQVEQLFDGIPVAT